MTGQNPLLERAIALDGNPDAIRQFYTEWGEVYDQELLETIGYVAPRIAAEALVRHIGEKAIVLDAGCGTGLVGAELRKRRTGLTIDGVDLTPEMLVLSSRRGIYRQLSEADLTGPLNQFAEDTYDGIVSAGVFTSGHVGPAGLDNLIRIAKPGAPIVITVRDSAWEADGFKDHVEALEAGRSVSVLSITLSPYHTKEGIMCQLVILQVT
ncbi:class I SAM-dependent methyltransferase [Roseibium sp. RKSG952]|uniref:class I SAM-dependent DNA methyltransferase n=1 Tax=Roseibium sp. RKSG952 TaxID=2529384 RepID=UPI0012BBE919|nr:class I SAM-dependent methyltransferase [Roseibium sp. RKSG952]MTI00017.1 methyltransferase domain-containing protein [Roseibium sp. RKSG952]